jgi:hypothetical protein
MIAPQGRRFFWMFINLGQVCAGNGDCLKRKPKVVGVFQYLTELLSHISLVSQKGSLE